MTPEVKLRSLAAADATLAGYLTGSNNTFRWFDRQVAQNYFQSGPCVRVIRVSTVRMYMQTGVTNVSACRFQIDVLSVDPEQARAIAAAIIDFLGTVDLAGDYQFGSPVTTPPQFPNFILNQRAGMDYQLQPPAYVETLDARIFNLEEE